MSKRKRPLPLQSLKDYFHDFADGHIMFFGKFTKYTNWAAGQFMLAAEPFKLSLAMLTHLLIATYNSYSY